VWTKTVDDIITKVKRGRPPSIASLNPRHTTSAQHAARQASAGQAEVMFAVGGGASFTL
jgi:sulfur carrier protein ThiS